MGKISKKVSREIIKKSFIPLVLLLVIAAGYLYYRMKIAALIPEKMRQELEKYIITIFVFSLGVISQSIVEAIVAWYKVNVAAKTPTRLDDELVPFVRRTLKILIWVVALLIILPLYGLNISALVTVLGVSSLAIALAAQDTIANIIAGFLIMLDRPFRIGDKIKLPSGEIVEVLDIGVRRSKFLSEDKAIIIVPNVDLSKNKIINYTYGEQEETGG